MVAPVQHWGDFILHVIHPGAADVPAHDAKTKPYTLAESVNFSPNPLAISDARQRVWRLEYVVVNWAFAISSCTRLAERLRDDAEERHYEELRRWVKVTKSSAERVAPAHRELLLESVRKVETVFADCGEDAHYELAATDTRSRGDIRIGGLLWSFDQLRRACSRLTRADWSRPDAFHRLATIPGEFWANSGAEFDGKAIEVENANMRIHRFAKTIRPGHEEAVMVLHLRFVLDPEKVMIGTNGRVNIPGAAAHFNFRLL